MLSPDAGSLLGLFQPAGNLIALEFNLDTNFGASMFARDFAGRISGRVEPVPEPSTPALLIPGLMMAAFFRRPPIGQTGQTRKFRRGEPRCCPAYPEPAPC